MKEGRRRILRALPISVAVVTFTFGPMAKQKAPPKAVQQVDFVQREKSAPAEIRKLLEQFRAQISEKNLSFQVGYTTAMDKKLEVLAATRLPQNLPVLAAKQNELAKELISEDMAARDSFDKSNPHLLPEIILRDRFPMTCTAQSAFDWRKLDKVTPVRDQDGCGSCWDFSALGAYEGSYLLRNNIAVDASEQQILSCSKGGTCAGGWPYLVFQYLISNGTATLASYPYTAADSPCNTSISTPYRAVAWGYVDRSGGIPSVQAMKDALCLYGPLSITVYVDGLFQAYTAGVFKDIPSSSSPRINHAITLIGWDDSKGAWLIKNSWGIGWGETGGYGSERGYMWIDYNTNKIGMAAAWVEAQNRFYILPPEYFKKLPNIRPMPKPLQLDPSAANPSTDR
jgi:C1A family cysteine protease